MTRMWRQDSDPCRRRTDRSPCPQKKNGPTVIVECYRDTDAAAWGCLRAGDPGTDRPRSFDRGYMDYHRNRFPDHSLLIRDPGYWSPSCRQAARDRIGSHRGLS